MQRQFWLHMAIFAANVSQELNTVHRTQFTEHSSPGANYLVRICGVQVRIAFAFAGSINRAIVYDYCPSQSCEIG